MKKNIGALLALCFLMALGVAAQEKKEEIMAVAANAQNAVSDAPRGYVLGPGDEIEVKVFGEEQLGGRYTIDENGKIEFEFVDQPIRAACRTEREVRADITTALKKFLRSPQVNVRITERRSRPPAVVYGEVRVPQRIEMQRRARLQELLAFSGGPTEKAGGVIEVWHTQPVQCPEPGETLETTAPTEAQNLNVEVFKLSDINAGKTDANPYIRPGDVVVVQKAPPVYIVGEVRMLPPEGISIQETGLSLTEAIARVGGLTREAKKKDVRIYRLKQGATNTGSLKDRDMISVNLDLIKKGEQSDVLLQPYDVVEVEKAKKNPLQVVTEILIGGARTLTTQTLPTRVFY